MAGGPCEVRAGRGVEDATRRVDEYAAAIAVQAVLDHRAGLSALRPDTGQQDGQVGRDGANGFQIVGMCRAHDQAARAGLRPDDGFLREHLVQRAPVRVEAQNIRGAGIGCEAQEKGAAISIGQKRGDSICAHQRIDGHGIHAELSIGHRSIVFGGVANVARLEIEHDGQVLGNGVKRAL